MEIKRKTEIFIETRRQFVISQPEAVEQIFCPQCGETMVAAEQAAVFFGTSRRNIYQCIETGAVHFAETDAGAVMICLSSLAAMSGVEDENRLTKTIKEVNRN